MTQSNNITSGKTLAVADLQGFLYDNNEFILKELCFSILSGNTSSDKSEYHHYIFAPPIKWYALSKKCRASALWLRTFHHGFFWNQGQIHYNDRIDYIKPLLQENLIILVKGRQKIQWLKEVCRNSTIDVRDIEKELTDEFTNFRLADEAYKLSNVHHCRMHGIVKHCAKQNVKIIENWIKEHTR